MKVIIVSPAWPLRGGIANSGEQLCQACIDAGMEAEMVSFSKQYPGFLFPGKTQFDHESPAPGFKIHTLIHSYNPLNWLKVARFIKQQNADFVIMRFWIPFMGPCLGTIAKLVRGGGKSKVIGLTDNVVPHEHRIGDKPFTRYFLRRCDGFITMSQSVLEDLSLFVKSPKAVFLPHPLYDRFGPAMTKEAARKHLDLDPEKPYILFFGFIRKYKGLDLLLEAMADSRIKEAGIQLVVAGEFYGDREYYDDLIQQLGLENLVLRTEYIATDDVKAYFCAADLIVQPYRTATQSGVAQIAYHFDRPMVVTNVGGLPEIVPDQKAGYVTEVDSNAIANAIHDYYDNNREAEFTAQVKIEKKRFLWSTFVEKMSDFLKTL